MQQDVLLLWGAQDEILPPQLADKWEAALTSRAGRGTLKRVMVDRAGHSPQLERPDFVAEQMLAWLREQGLGGGRGGGGESHKSQTNAV